MKDEIKEYLDYFKKYATISEKAILEDIEDYITNLQEENEGLHTRIKTIKRRRKEQTAKIRKYREEITNKQNSNKDYKTRIDKAIEYINKHFHWGINGNDNIDDLLNILQGKSDE